MSCFYSEFKWEDIMNKHKEYDILMQFTYDDVDYVIVTDNTYNEKGEFNMYGARVGVDGRLREVYDTDMMDVFNVMIERYKEKIIKGEI